MPAMWKVVLSVAGVLLVAIAAQADTVTLSRLESDAAMSLLNPTVSCVAEGRIGDAAGKATFELDLGRSTAAPDTQAQFGWVNGQATPMSLRYDKAAGQMTFTVGQTSLTYGFDGLVTDLFLRTRAGAAGSSMTLTGLTLNGLGIDATGSNYASGHDTDILWIHAPALNDGFELTGLTTMAWSGTMPRNSNLAYQIKMGAASVPEPMTLGLLAGGAGLLSMYRRRKA